MTSNCTNVPISNGVPASCTITNTETTTTFTVNKVYCRAGPVTPVPVTVTCSSGIVTTLRHRGPWLTVLDGRPQLQRERLDLLGE